VYASAIGLDGDALGVEDEVDPERPVAIARVNPGVHLRVGNAGAADDRQEGLLELAPRRGAPDVVLGEDRLDGSDAVALGVAVELVVQRPEIEQLEDLGLVEDPLQRAAGEHGGEVEEGARHRGGGDVVDPGGVGRLELR
jgi:hypothetical protein